MVWREKGAGNGHVEREREGDRERLKAQLLSEMRTRAGKEQRPNTEDDDQKQQQQTRYISTHTEATAASEGKIWERGKSAAAAVVQKSNANAGSRTSCRGEGA